MLLAAYLLVVEPRAPWLRAALMAAAVCIAIISGRAISSANALAAAAIVLLIADPLSLFRPGFQLSFGIVCGLMILHRRIRQLLFGRWLSRRKLMVLQADQRVARFMKYPFPSAVMDLVSASLAAYLAAAPLVAYHFGLFTPYAPLLTVLLLPLVVLVLAPAYLSMGLAWPMPNLADRVGELAVWSAGLLEWVISLPARLPGLSFDLFVVPLWTVALCYAALGLWAILPRRRWLWAPAMAAAAVAVAISQLPASAPTDGQLHVLDVGHGAMVLLHAPNGRTYLFDAGSLNSHDAYGEVLRPFLRAKRLPGPEAVFVSHDNVDHFNALPALLKRHTPRTIFVGRGFGQPRPGLPPKGAELLKLCRRRGVTISRLSGSQTITLGEHTYVDVLSPPADKPLPGDINDRSLVLRIACRDRRVLLPADAGPEPLAELTRAGRDAVAADVLLLPHHGAATPALAAFIEAVGPETLIQSGRARPDSRKLLEALGGRRRLITWREGWIHVDLAEDELRIETMRPRAGDSAAP